MTDDERRAIEARLTARDRLDALLAAGGMGTMEHRVLDDMVYSSDVERDIRALLTHIDVQAARIAELEAGLREIKHLPSKYTMLNPDEHEIALFEARQEAAVIAHLALEGEQ